MIFKFKTDPYEHQLEAFEKTKQMAYAAYFMEQGTGKTKVNIDRSAYLFCEEKINAHFVICPNSLTDTWLEEFETHCSIPYVPGVWSPNLTKKKTAELERVLYHDSRNEMPVLIMNIEAIRTEKGAKLAHWFLQHKVCNLNCDESSKIKTPSAAQTVAAIRLSRLAKARSILTGTPIDKSPAEFFSQLEFLMAAPLGYENYYTFRAQYCELKTRVQSFRAPRKNKKGSNQYKRKITDIVGSRNEEELQKKLLPFSVFVRKDDCLDLPPKIPHKRTTSLTPEGKRIYESIKNEIITEIDEQRLLTVEFALARFIRLQQVTGGFLPSDDDPKAEPIPGENPKIKLLEETIEEFPGPALIWSRFQAEHHAIYELLKTIIDEDRIGFITGPTKKNEREENRKSFQRGYIKYLICSQPCAGYGYTLTKAEHCLYYSNTFSLEHRLQSEDRPHRIGLDHKVNYVDLMIPKTIEQTIYYTLIKKRQLSDAIMDVKDIGELI